MTTFAVASCRGAPGATTVVIGLAAAWPGPVRPLVVEADPNGGVLAARFESLRADRTLADVAVGARRHYDHDRVLGAARLLWGAIPVVVAPPSGEQAVGAFATAGELLGQGLAAVAQPVVVDVGRLSLRSPALPLARCATATVVVTRAGFEDVAALATRCAELRSGGCEPSLVVVGEGPYPPGEVAAAAGAEVIGVLPHDPRGAAALAGSAGGDRRLRRSLLWRSLADLATRLAALAPVPEPTAVDVPATVGPATAGTAVDATPDQPPSRPVGADTVVVPR